MPKSKPTPNGYWTGFPGSSPGRRRPKNRERRSKRRHREIRAAAAANEEETVPGPAEAKAKEARGPGETAPSGSDRHDVLAEAAGDTEPEAVIESDAAEYPPTAISLPPAVAPGGRPSDTECSAGLDGGYIADSRAGDEWGDYLLPLSVFDWENPAEEVDTLMHRCLRDSVESMLEAYNAQASPENRLGGWGWHSHQWQIEKRKRHCGTSDYDIYEKPAGDCSPPAATPGHSHHQFGLAIDFYCRDSLLMRDNCGGAFDWLDCRAAAYGLINLPSEPWHWYYPLNNGRRLDEKVGGGCQK